MRLIILFSFLAIFTVSCSHLHLRGTSSILYKTEEFDKNNSSLDSIINPYRKKVALEMNVVIGEVETNLKKEQPESNIGNWACDALAEQTAIYTNTTVDFAILNYGGLRIGSIAQGEINKGKIFELMPFDNSVVIIEMPGKELDSLFTHMAIKGGWPVSADLKIVADKSGHVKTVKIKNQAIDPEKTYHIASIDYLANGGDNCSFFIGKKQIQTDVLLREAIIDNVDKKHKAGKKINAVKEGRFIVE